MIYAPSIAWAQGQGSGSGGSGSDNGNGGGSDNSGGSGGQSGASGSGGTQQGGSGNAGGSSDTTAAAAPEDKGAGSSGSAGSGSGTGGSGSGNSGNTGGTGSGDLYGDLFVILRDDNGLPILNDAGFVQPIDSEGNLIALDEGGAPIDPELAIEVDLGRLNVGRAPQNVLDTRTEEVVSLLTSASAISQDVSGRLVLTIDDVEKTLDSPLDNLAIYTALLTTGTIADLTPDDLAGTDYDFLVDGSYTIEDLDMSAALLAAATDKTSPFTSDEIAYIDSFLGINTTVVGDVTYSVIDYADFEYDRSDTYDEQWVDVLVYNETTGTWDEKSVDIYTAVFGDEDITVSGTLDAYTQAAEDAREVVEFIHEYALPLR